MGQELGLHIEVSQTTLTTAILAATIMYTVGKVVAVQLSQSVGLKKRAHMGGAK